MRWEEVERWVSGASSADCWARWSGHTNKLFPMCVMSYTTLLLLCLNSRQKAGRTSSNANAKCYAMLCHAMQDHTRP